MIPIFASGETGKSLSNEQVCDLLLSPIFAAIVSNPEGQNLRKLSPSPT